MSNVLYFQQALAARNARVTDRARFLSALGNLGAADDLVYRIQYDLTRVATARGPAYFNPQGVDGIWGPNTAAAVKSFRVASGLSAEGDTKEALVDNAFLAALAAAAKGANAATTSPTPAAGGGGGAITIPPGARATLPWYEQAKTWLLAPGQPIYKRPVLYVGAGILGLTIFLALRKRD